MCKIIEKRTNSKKYNVYLQNKAVRGMTTYTKFKEYIWLVNTIYHARAITFAEINERWPKTNMSEGVEMARTILRHKPKSDASILNNGGGTPNSL